MLFHWLILIVVIQDVLGSAAHRRVVRETDTDSDTCEVKELHLVGKCVNIKDCPYTYNFISKRAWYRLNPKEKDFLFKSKCGKESEMKICCLPCGKLSTSKNANRIIGGGPAYSGDIPWMVALIKTPYKKRENDFICGGSLISDEWVLTAAHCVKNIGPPPNAIRLGDININDSVKDNVTATDIPIEKIIIHPNYSNKPVQLNDIALILLKYPVLFGENIRPVCLPTADEYKKNSYYNRKRGMIAGWGATGFAEIGSDMLLKADVNIASLDTCQDEYRKFAKHAVIDERVLCAKGKTDSCQGDSGGPMTLWVPDKKGYYLFGIVSYGIGCGDETKPGVYTRVPYYVDWVRNVTRSHEKPVQEI